MPVIEFRQRIADALSAFSAQSLHTAGLGFFHALGYDSDRRLRVEPPTPQNFLATLSPSRPPGQAALLADWRAADFLFQITTDEVRSLAQGAFKFNARGNYDANTFDSYLFVAIELAQPRYTRTQLAGVVREINRLFPQPVLVLLRHGDTVSLGIVHRRPGKRDTSRDVLEKVTLIMDISAGAKDLELLRAHVEILSEFSLDELQADYPFHDFAGLHAAWEKRLATYQLNERFYRDIANWYFWALKPDTGIVYPRDIEKSDFETEEGREMRSIFLIRMLTRLIFCWFLQEKGLIPRDLFRRHTVAGLLKDASAAAGTYYRAVLQNLFFATLNQPLLDDHGKPARSFRGKNQSGGLHPHRGFTGLWRYEDEFGKGQKEVWLLKNECIPFLNGGLFECLDRKFRKSENKANVILDGYSDNKAESCHVPNDLFFGQDRLVDLTHIYADPKKAPKKPIEENVAGLITILGRYKFTVVENTPFEEEVALDPELLGKVFENLLASYNEDTRTTARKATGSFYTPREIVSYMVDEALHAYLEASLGLQSLANASKENPPGSLGPVQKKLKQLFDHSNEENPFGEKETVALIAAIDRVKILDPACGSGAFPMGALHRLVALLGKLDRNNRRWKEQQLRKVERDRQLAAQMEDEELRRATLTEAADRAADIQRSFDTRFHDLDFARKLYLIENCIYGVDIQPIATQIAKLRFFIALIVDQRHDPAAPNRGVRPLPNLETKLVAADFLIPIERRQTQFQLFDDKVEIRRRIEKLKQELAFIRHEHFGARDPRKKERCRAEDARLREEMAGLLRETGMSAPQAAQLARWDPYDQNAHAHFFDSEWMFNLPIGRIRLDVATLLTLRGNFSFLNETTGQMELPACDREIESGFDVVLGNPPYVLLQNIGKRVNEMWLISQLYKSAAYKVDLYHLFMEAALRMLQPAGFVTYITPNTFLKNKHTRKLREILVRETHIHFVILFYCRVFQDPSVDNLVFMAQFAPPLLPNDRTIRVHEIREGRFAKEIVDFREVRQTTIRAPEFAFELDLNDSDADRIAQIEAGGIPFGEIGGTYFGIQTFDREAHVAERRVSSTYRPVIDGTNVNRWRVSPPTEFVDFRPVCIKSGGDPSIYARTRIVVRQIGNFPEGSISPDGLLTLNTIYNIYLKNEEYDLRFILGIVNSAVTRFYWLKKFFDNKETFPKIKKAPLESIRVPKLGTKSGLTSQRQDVVSRIVDYLLWLHRQMDVTAGREPRDPVMLAFWEQVVNALVYELFFPTELAAARLAFFRLVDEAGLKPLAELPTADGRKTCINDAERLTSLRTTFERLSASNHALAAALFTLGGLDFVRLIEGRK